MKKVLALALMVAATVAGCSTAPSWPVASRELDLSAEQLDDVTKRFETASRLRLGSDRDVLELSQLALEEIPVETSDPSSSRVSVEDIRWAGRNLTLVHVLSRWWETGGRSASGFYYGGTHFTSYIVVLERSAGGWRRLRTYRWSSVSAIS